MITWNCAVILTDQRCCLNWDAFCTDVSYFSVSCFHACALLPDFEKSAWRLQVWCHAHTTWHLISLWRVARRCHPTSHLPSQPLFIPPPLHPVSAGCPSSPWRRDWKPKTYLRADTRVDLFPALNLIPGCFEGFSQETKGTQLVVSWFGEFFFLVCYSRTMRARSQNVLELGPDILRWMHLFHPCFLMSFSAVCVGMRASDSLPIFLYRPFSQALSPKTGCMGKAVEGKRRETGCLLSLWGMTLHKPTPGPTSHTCMRRLMQTVLHWSGILESCVTK